MKNVLIFCLLSLISVALNAQGISKSKTDNVSKRQIAIDTREMQQFEEQMESLSKALEAKNQKDITAIKLMLEETMLRKIQTTSGATSSATGPTLSPNKRASREAAGAKYLEQKKKNGQLVAVDNNKETRQSQSTNKEDKWIVMRKEIYNQVSSMRDTNDKMNRVRLEKLLSTFYDTLEQDLMEKKKQLTAK